MNRKNIIAVVCLLCVFAFGANAQSYETMSKWNKKSAPCVAITVDAPTEIAIQSLFDLLKSNKLSGKKSKKDLRFENVTFPTISTDYINIYALASEKNNNSSVVYVFVNKGKDSDFISSSTDRNLIENLRNFLDTKYVDAAAKANLDYKIKVQNDLIKSSNKDLTKMQKDLDNKIKQREKMGKDIEDLAKSIEQQKKLLEQQNQDLSKIGSGK